MRPGIELWGVELPGRGSRLREAPVVDVATLGAELLPPLRAIMDVPTVFFGHSMGAILAFWCGRELLREGKRLLRRLVVSARIAAHRPNPHATVPHIGDRDLAEVVRRSGGTSSMILDDPDLMALFLPMIRSDFALLASFLPEAPTALPLPITVLGGAQDGITRLMLEEWQHHTTEPLDCEIFPGGHFFINDSRPDVVAYISSLCEQAA